MRSDATRLPITEHLVVALIGITLKLRVSAMICIFLLWQINRLGFSRGAEKWTVAFAFVFQTRSLGVLLGLSAGRCELNDRTLS